jgi:hypothetical protein
MTFIAGPYTVTYGGNTLGITERGFELEYTSFAEPIIGDNLGDSKQDGVYRGGNLFINFILSEMDLAGVQAAFWPYGTIGAVGQVGRLQTNIAVALAFSEVAGTTAAAEANLDNFTVTKAILAEGFDVRILLSAAHRKIPMRLQALPTGGTPAWFTLT